MDSVLVSMLKKLIAAGLTEGLSQKIDLFYALGRINDAEYAELVALLG